MPQGLLGECTELGFTQRFLISGALALLRACCRRLLKDVFIVAHMVLRSHLDGHIQVLVASHRHHVS